MAELNTEGKKPVGGKKGPKKVSTRVDFTPMVDLGFLLITFFMLTTTLIKPQTMEISMPSRDKVEKTDENKVKASQAITILLGNDNKVFYYFGTREDNVDPELIETDFSSEGIRKILLQRNAGVVLKVHDLKVKRDNNKLSEDDFKKQASEARAVKTAPIIVIKATEESSYRNLVDILDEMQICNIGRYAIVDIAANDLKLLGKLNLTTPNR